MYVYIFRRDLRWYDNTTFYLLWKTFEKDPSPSKKFLACFILDPQQMDPQKNPYFSPSAFQYIMESVYDLYQQASFLFTVLKGVPLSIVEQLHQFESISHLGMNKDYSPFAIQRDKQIETWCQSQNIIFLSKEDLLLLPFTQSNKKDGKPYTRFTPFRNHAWKLPISPILRYNLSFQKYKHQSVWMETLRSSLNTPSITYWKHLTPTSKISLPSHPILRGGRNVACQQLSKLKRQTHYATQRNCLQYTTSLLGSPLSYGCLSIREVFFKTRQCFGHYSSFESELWWREFYFSILFHFPHVLQGFFKPEWKQMKWISISNAWKYIYECSTGFPIIDASLKQLYTTGWTSNRSRMFLTSFMSKDLGLSPMEIERWWANHLLDYCVSSTNGGVSWTIGYGVDALQANRIFNPWTQSQKYDPNAIFIHQWLPQLKSIPASHLHQWDIYYSQYTSLSYPKPIVNHSIQRKLFLNRLRSSLRKNESS